MIDVYVLLVSDWDECGLDTEVFGVFKSQEDAEDYKIKHRLEDNYFNIIIERHRLDLTK